MKWSPAGPRAPQTLLIISAANRTAPTDRSHTLRAPRSHMTGSTASLGHSVKVRTRIRTTCVSGPTSELESDELDDEEDEESLELSDAMPVDSCRSTLSASVARSGRSCFKILEQPIQTGFTPNGHLLIQFPRR
ncbi:hypothetical protein XENOCAPTIV_016219 [Xenoophorus captivus]|uniref:Uncharacterized protein n=1 Tax=Xenoophorus captivus TaxID=1517983 RepID=A0ABV0QIJ9_9TELE